MSYISKFTKWGLVNEVRKNRVCPVIDFAPLRESQVYKDLISLGWEEVNAKGEPRLSAETFQGERQGNLRFMHPQFPRSIRINLNGAIWEDERTGKAHRIYIEYDHDPKWFKNCLNMGDYENRLEYLIKKLLYAQNWISKQELVSAEGALELIKRKLDEFPESVKTLKVIPPSLQQDQGYLKTADDFGLI